VILAKVVAYDERRGHVYKTRTHAVHEAVRHEEPLHAGHEWRTKAAHAEYDRPDQATDTIAAGPRKRTNVTDSGAHESDIQNDSVATQS